MQPVGVQQQNAAAPSEAKLTVDSNMSTGTPARCKAIAQTRPDTPPPTMATRKSLIVGSCIERDSFPSQTAGTSDPAVVINGFPESSKFAYEYTRPRVKNKVNVQFREGSTKEVVGKSMGTKRTLPKLRHARST